jgi:phage shock protein PspC (stress-responsive transcriptional regulator)
MMETQQNSIALPLRSHTILGVCEAVGEDFGFNPIFLRIPFAVGVLWNPLITFAAYFALGAVVLGSRLLFPRAKHPDQVDQSVQVTDAANEQAELARAA